MNEFLYRMRRRPGLLRVVRRHPAWVHTPGLRADLPQVSEAGEAMNPRLTDMSGRRLAAGLRACRARAVPAGWPAPGRVGRWWGRRGAGRVWGGPAARGPWPGRPGAARPLAAAQRPGQLQPAVQRGRHARGVQDGGVEWAAPAAAHRGIQKGVVELGD